jgi:hypothetical protein
MRDFDVAGSRRPWICRHYAPGNGLRFDLNQTENAAETHCRRTGLLPERGLYAAVIGGFLVSAPAGAFVVLVAASLASLNSAWTGLLANNHR